MQIKDYIFYRMYLAYKKHEGAGRFSATLYVSAIETLLTFPFIFILLSIIKAKGDLIVLLMFSLPAILFLIMNYRRYFKRGMIEQLKSKFKNSRYNHWIKNWMLYLLMFIIAAWGFLGIMPILKFFQFIESLIRG